MTDAASGSRRGSRTTVDWKGYGRLLAMVLTSTVVMYFFMYWNIYRIEDFVLSETRAFMATLMGGAMLAIMLSFMLRMYRALWVNLALYGLSVALFAAGLWLVRSQTTVQDVSWMKSMIPHHSIAIMVSERAELSDPRVRKLADEIIAAQEKEIAEMEWLIGDIEANGEVSEHPLGGAEGPTPVGGVAEALSLPAISTLDVGGMTEAEVAQVVPDPVCSFRFSEQQQTLAAVGADGAGVMKLAGTLVPLTLAEGELRRGPGLAAEGLALSVNRSGGGDAAELIFELGVLGRPLRVGYEGVYICGT
jgi:hypothetical protein